MLTMPRPILVALLAVLLAGCRAPHVPPAAPPAAIPGGSYYRIAGFYVHPLEQLPLGAGHDLVTQRLGPPTRQFQGGFQEPNRVKLAALPRFDEQWGWFEGLANNWVFFRDGRVVAAFREESDW